MFDLVLQGYIHSRKLMVNSIDQRIPQVDTKVLDMNRYTNHTIDMLSGAGDFGTFPGLEFCACSTVSNEFLLTRGINLTLGLGVLALFPLLALPWILIRRKSNKLADTTVSLRTLRKDNIPNRRQIICIRSCIN
jgi:hypothetical protein